MKMFDTSWSCSNFQTKHLLDIFSWSPLKSALKHSQVCNKPTQIAQICPQNYPLKTSFCPNIVKIQKLKCNMAYQGRNQKKTWN